MKWTLSLLIGLVCTTAFAGEIKTNGVPSRVGIYDSRAVAYAYFWSDAHQKKLQETVAAAKAAKQSGDTNEYQRLEAVMRGRQADMHRQVFSVAPANEAMTSIKERIPEIEKQAGVGALVSKWDSPALKQFEEAEKVDVTDQLVREFIKPTEKQDKVIKGLIKSEPLSLEKCDKLIREGKI